MKIAIVRASIGIIVLTVFVAHACANATKCSYHYAQEVFVLSGHNVLVESYQPDGPGPFPLVFMLHGSAGAFTLPVKAEPQNDNFGERTLAQECLAVVLPHYLEAIGRKSIVSREELDSNIEALDSALEFLLDNAEKLPYVRGESVFLFGESLGGYLSIRLAFAHPEISAASEFGGGLPPGAYLARSANLRVLIAHGSDDSVVPIEEATQLQKYCKDHNIQVQINIYEGEGHYFSSATLSSVIQNTITFFNQKGLSGQR